MRRDEAVCESCGGPNHLSWFADSNLWNATYRRPGTYEPSFVCPNCFLRDARAAGVDPVAWRLSDGHPDLTWKTGPA